MKALTIPAPVSGMQIRKTRGLSQSTIRRVATAVAIVATVTAWFTAAACDLETSRLAQFITAAAVLLATISAFAAVPRQKGGVE